MQAMIFAAGLGTRLRPITNTLHKSLVLINGKTLLERNMQFLIDNKINYFVINVFYLSEQIIDFLSNCKLPIQYKISNEYPNILETGGGLKNAFHLFNKGEPILTLNADILTNYDLTLLLKFHNYEQNFISLAVSNRISQRGLLTDENNVLMGWYNHTTQQQRLITPNATYSQFRPYSGISILNYNIYKYFLEADKFTLIDLFFSIGKQEKIKCLEYQMDQYKFIDVGNMENIAKATTMFS